MRALRSSSLCFSNEAIWSWCANSRCRRAPSTAACLSDTLQCDPGGVSARSLLNWRKRKVHHTGRGTQIPRPGGPVGWETLTGTSSVRSAARAPGQRSRVVQHVATEMATGGRATWGEERACMALSAAACCWVRVAFVLRGAAPFSAGPAAWKRRADLISAGPAPCRPDRLGAALAGGCGTSSADLLPTAIGALVPSAARRLSTTRDERDMSVNVPVPWKSEGETAPLVLLGAASASALHPSAADSAVGSPG